MEMNLSSDEYEAVMEMRRKKIEKRLALVVYVLGVARNYLEWLQAEGAGDTYSTFCDDFGFHQQEPLDRQTTYAFVQECIKRTDGVIAANFVVEAE